MASFGIAALWVRARTSLSLLRSFQHQAGARRSRRALQRLDDHLLRDIGLTRHEAEAEAARASWDASPHWRS